MSQSTAGRSRLLFALALGSALGSAAAVAWLPGPAFLVPALWLGFGMAAAVTPGPPPRRGLGLTLAFLMLLFLVLEAIWSGGPDVRAEGSAIADYVVPHDVLGYAPAPGHETTYRRYVGDALVYDVTYSIDESGLRVSPPATDPDAPCVLFFGGSFTFGEGLENEDALHWQVAEESAGRVGVHNFGFHGYGPHQMLAAIQLGLVDEAIACTPRWAVHQAARFHVSRAAGLSFWEEGGPRYEASANGGVEYRGKWRPVGLRAVPGLARAASASAALGKLLQLQRPPNEADYARYLAILETTRRELADRWPGAELLLVVWDDPGDPLAEDLDARGFRMLRVSEILAGRETEPARYQLHPLDGHPSAFAMERIAQRIVAELDGQVAATRGETQ